MRTYAARDASVPSIIYPERVCDALALATRRDTGNPRRRGKYPALVLDFLKGWCMGGWLGDTEGRTLKGLGYFCCRGKSYAIIRNQDSPKRDQLPSNPFDAGCTGSFNREVPLARRQLGAPGKSVPQLCAIPGRRRSPDPSRYMQPPDYKQPP